MKTPLARLGPGGVELTRQVQVAKALGVSEKTVSLWVRREDWPVSRRPPWSVADLDAIRSWRAGLQEDRANAAGNGEAAAGGGGKKRSIDWLLKRERRLKIKLEREIQAGLYVRKEILENVLTALAELFVGTLLELEQALPSLVAGRDPGQVEKLLHDRFNAARARLAERRVLELQRADEAIRSEGKKKARGKKVHR